MPLHSFSAKIPLGMDRVEAGFVMTAITSAIVLIGSIAWLAVP